MVAVSEARARTRSVRAQSIFLSVTRQLWGCLELCPRGCPGAFYVHFYHGRSSVRLRLLVPPLFLILVAGGNLYRVGQLPWAMAFFSQGTKSMLH